MHAHINTCTNPHTCRMHARCRRGEVRGGDMKIDRERDRERWRMMITVRL